MRDPAAALVLGESVVTRHLHEALPSGHFLRSALASRWVESERLIPFRWTGDRELQAPRLPFVSQPTEWCDAQLHDAARFTLDLQSEAVAEGFDLKDASAWNVLFDGARPVFCDLLSFVPLTDRRWWAAGQFSRHFVLPLAVQRAKRLHARTAFLLSRDGMLPADARRILGVSRFFTRFWPMMADAGASVRPPAVAKTTTSPEALRSHRNGLHATLSWMLDGTRAERRRPPSVWSDYSDERGHYPVGSVDRKREVLQAWLARLRPAWVLDLGCNTGEFSRMAADLGAQVVAVDGDHDAVQALYCDRRGRRGIHPVVASLDDLSGGRGWQGQEHPGLMQRIHQRFDLAMMLALVHHLVVSGSIPLEAAARFVSACTTRWAVVEWIDELDPQMILLCQQRQRSPAEFSMDAQRKAFLAAGFTLVEEEILHPGTRRLALLELRA